MSAEIFHKNLRTLRKNSRNTQRKISERIGVELKRYQKWEEGRSQPDIDNIITIALVHGITTDELFNFEFHVKELMILV